MLAVIVVGLTAFALLAAKFVQSDGNLWPRDDFWRRTLPWPRGVQEDDEIAWHVPPTVPTSAALSARPVSLGRPVPPTTPQRRIAGR
jgi:hypothetical protein